MIDEDNLILGYEETYNQRLCEIKDITFGSGPSEQRADAMSIANVNKWRCV